MSGYEVEIGQLRSAAKAAGSAADQARVVEPGTGLGAVAGALAGGEAAKCAPALASAFTERAKGWAGEIEQWGESVSASATAYAENEDSAAGAFGR
ncbi:hypothetical protein [Actinokineospora terrae]|uniref:Excreted virulence factor EspC, type VII ESX diderm n=1 Tax=Actinokineospora terrae TaxID=155974 RepID=A0A1H9NWQ0_9PSEU|nr:hypothetical protein [Actinokineospora terrae]SER39999.1 hypothetical protein SAMN04487818_103160 [Actinokineospora terrae]